jgi:hypothetical protein
MTQTLYARMNIIKKGKKNKEKREGFLKKDWLIKFEINNVHNDTETFHTRKQGDANENIWAC